MSDLAERIAALDAEHRRLSIDGLSRILRSGARVLVAVVAAGAAGAFIGALLAMTLSGGRLF